MRPLQLHVEQVPGQQVGFGPGAEVEGLGAHQHRTTASGAGRERQPSGRTILLPGDAAYHAQLVQEAEDLRREKREERLEIAPPPFMKGLYRPRNLTVLVGEFMRELDPEGPFTKGIRSCKNGEQPYMGADPLRIAGDIRESIAHRYAYLARRYTGLDLLRKGMVFEVLGRFYPKVLKPLIKTIRGVLESRLRPNFLEFMVPKLEVQELRIWLAMGRRVAWDQIFALRPDAPGHLYQMVQGLIHGGEADEVRVPFQKGFLGAVSLTHKGWREARVLDPDLDDLGFGPHRRTQPGKEFHDSAVVDAIGYFSHLAEADGAKNLGIILDEGLKRRDNEHQLGIPDFRVEMDNRMGVRTALDVEVMGVSKHYRASHRDASSQGVWRLGFDPIGRKTEHSGSIIRIGR